MPSVKMKTHKGLKKRFKVSATGKVSHKRCGSSHLNSHKSGKQIRRLRKKSVLKINADARRYRHALRTREAAARTAEAAAHAAAEPEGQAEPAPTPAAE
ncbi:MAG TPA: 50S ribosomal protein L35 [Isosphaeraceae bacterium]|jgi:large subunit ribosomal protein L35|nr:50S ribosomal protein L35 [Isosphaeraceae bacterium]